MRQVHGSLLGRGAHRRVDDALADPRKLWIERAGDGLSGFFAVKHVFDRMAAGRDEFINRNFVLLGAGARLQTDRFFVVVA